MTPVFCLLLGVAVLSGIVLHRGYRAAEIESQSLIGRTEDEIADLLGLPSYTRESGSEWHYIDTDVQIDSVLGSKPILLLAFSDNGIAIRATYTDQLGECY